jgi:[ribosomal protein S5]-alanine N-acetyltransferase
MWPFLRPEPSFRIPTDGLYLRSPRASDYGDWRELRHQSRAFLEPWEPLWAPDELTRVSFERRLHRYVSDRNSGAGFAFFLFEAHTDTLMGGANLAFVRRGAAQSAVLGYWMGAPFAGKGHMTRAVKAIIPYAFDTLRLHRVEAACLPHNTASIRLLEKTGFAREGYARGYLNIAGKWQDHFLYARVNPAG